MTLCTECKQVSGVSETELAAMDELQHECGVAAVYHLDSGPVSDLLPTSDPNSAARLVPRMLLDMQNRGQLAAGITTYKPGRSQGLV